MGFHWPVLSRIKTDLRFCPYTENAGQWKPIFSYNLCSVIHSIIFLVSVLCSLRNSVIINYIIIVLKLNLSHKKRKHSLEGSLDRVLFAAEFEFPKILVPRLPQHTSNVNIECAGKSEWSKQLYSLYVTSFLEHWYNLILLFWY